MVHTCVLVVVVCCLATKFDKEISSQERGGGVRGVEQWIRMATDYKIVVVPDTGGTRPCMHASSAPSVWVYNYYLDEANWGPQDACMFWVSAVRKNCQH